MDAKEFMELHLLYSAEMVEGREYEIDESVFEEIYRIQEEQDDKERVHEKKE